MKDITLKITGTQISVDMEEDQLEFITEGELREKDGALLLSYDESEFSGMPGCRTQLKLHDGVITMTRSGKGIGLDTEIEFEKGKRYNGYYDTPYGTIQMEVLTNSLRSDLTGDGRGSIDIDYNISLKGLSEGRNKLNIQLM